MVVQLNTLTLLTLLNLNADVSASDLKVKVRFDIVISCLKSTVFGVVFSFNIPLHEKAGLPFVIISVSPSLVIVVSLSSSIVEAKYILPLGNIKYLVDLSAVLIASLLSVTPSAIIP